jgi:hypothetical protein
MKQAVPAIAAMLLFAAGGRVVNLTGSKQIWFGFYAAFTSLF